MPTTRIPNHALTQTLDALDRLAARTDLPVQEAAYPATVTRRAVREAYDAYLDALKPIVAEYAERETEGPKKGQPRVEVTPDGHTKVHFTAEGRRRYAELLGAEAEVPYRAILLSALSGVSGDDLDLLLPFLDEAREAGGAAGGTTGGKGSQAEDDE